MYITERTLEAKFPTLWTDEKGTARKKQRQQQTQHPATLAVRTLKPLHHSNNNNNNKKRKKKKKKRKKKKKNNNNNNNNHNHNHKQNHNHNQHHNHNHNLSNEMFNRSTQDEYKKRWIA